MSFVVAKFIERDRIKKLVLSFLCKRKKAEKSLIEEKQCKLFCAHYITNVFISEVFK